MAEAPSENITSVPCHLEGITRVCFAPDGQTIFTGGTDCLVRIHKAAEPDAEPGFHDEHTDAVTSLACSSSHLVSASVDNIARYFSYPANEFLGYITRSSGVAIRWVALDKAGERVAVCSDDLLVKIVHIRDTTRVQLLSDNSKPVRSATWDPTGQYLTTISCDGKIRIYDTALSTPACIKVLEGISATSEADSTVSTYAAWHPSGAYFAVPTRTQEIALIARSSWTKQHTLTSDSPKAPVSELAFSPNGRYLASSSFTQILVWATDSRQVVAKHTNVEGAISGLAFSPTDNLLVFTSLDGSFQRWKEPIPSDLPSPVITEAAQAKRVEKLLDDDFGDADDVDEKGEDLEDLDDMADDWIVEDQDGYGKDDEERKWGKGRTEVVNVTKAQEAFTPGSTAMKNKKRYLGFNMVGVVDATDLETHHVINVEFHDKSSRRGYHFQDHNKFHMASIGEQGIVYASKAEDGEPSHVYYRPYDSWASQADWTISLPQAEEAVCIAAGGPAGALGSEAMGSVVVATSKGFIRFFSSSGIQRYVWRLGEDVVTMVAGKDSLLLVHREGGTSLDGCQNLRYTLMDLNNFEMIQESRLPLPRKVTLTWCGFTSNDAPVIFDSTGLLSTLDRFRRPGQARWVPLLDTSALKREGRTENYWPVGVGATSMSCIVLKGSEKEPWFPRPLIQEVDLRMPLLNTDAQQGKLEESVMRGEVYLNVLRDTVEDIADAEIEYDIKQREVALDKELLQLVQGACKADNLQRALDVTRLMHNSGTIEAAAKVAAFYHLPGLQERIMGVKADKERKKQGLRRSRKSLIAPSEDGLNASAGRTANARSGFSDFQPRTAPRRSFGGVGARDSTPAGQTGRGESFIPETPTGEDEPVLPVPGSSLPMPPVAREGSGSPKEKRKRVDEDDFAPPAARPLAEMPFSSAPKNPFAKKAQASNPFAKPTGGARPLDGVKSTSFFDRIDTIESTTKSKPKKAKENVRLPSNNSSGKQTTLFDKPPIRPGLPKHQSTLDSMSTEDSLITEDSTDSLPALPLSSVPIVGVLEERTAQETLDPEDESMDV